MISFIGHCLHPDIFKDALHTSLSLNAYNKSTIALPSPPPYPQSICFKTPNGCLNLGVGMIRIYSTMLFFSIHICHFTWRKHFTASPWHIQIASATAFALGILGPLSKIRLLEYKDSDTMTIDLITKRAVKWLIDRERIQHEYTGWFMSQARQNAGLHHTTQNST